MPGNTKNIEIKIPGQAEKDYHLEISGWNTSRNTKIIQ